MEHNELIEKMRAAYESADYHTSDPMVAALSVVMDAVLKEVDVQVPDGALPLSGIKCVRDRTVAEIRARLLKLAGHES